MGCVLPEQQSKPTALRKGMVSLRKLLTLAALLYAICLPSFGQLPTGTPIFGSFDSDGVNTINLGSLNIHTQIPIFSRPGKGLSFSAVLNHDNVFWYSLGGGWKYTTNGSATGLDWIGSVPAIQGMPAGYSTSVGTCSNHASTLIYSNWKYTDIFNTAHGTPLTLDSAGCLYGTSGTGTSADGYAISASVSSTQSSQGPNPPSAATQVTNASGESQWETYPMAYWQVIHSTRKLLSTIQRMQMAKFQRHFM